MTQAVKCWCGNIDLHNFSNEYLICDKCQTLVSQVGLNPEQIVVDNDETDFYGKEYWTSHQKDDLNLPSIKERTRSDLSERCLHWLRTVMKYKLPPAKILELGCAHGGFVALLKLAGYDATGLELSPSVVSYAQNTFDIPVLCGPIENQKIEKASLDVIALMDVIEHLPDPVATIQHCLSLLKSDGIMVLQCPCYQEQVTYEEMLTNNDPFLIQLKADEHLYLFSQSSIRHFFNKLGIKGLQFEKAIFEHYDMFMVAGRNPLTVYLQDNVVKTIGKHPTGHFVLALQDMGKQKEKLITRLTEIENNQSTHLQTIEQLGKQLAESEEDRSARLETIEQLGKQLAESEEDRSARLETIEQLGKHLAESEEDRIARLETIEQLGKQLAEFEEDRSTRLETIEQLGKQLAESEEDRRARLETIEQLGKQLAESEEDRSARLETIKKIGEQLAAVENARNEYIRQLNHFKETMKASWYGRYLLKKIDQKTEI